uniref:Uncharacterized protein n=1 Tax=Opuntia streptacantha TaxID=393608 RepID=A0A7C8YMJ1_OPUST
MASLVVGLLGTPILSRTSFSLPMASSLSPGAGTASSASGTSPPAPPLAALWATPRMCCPLLFPLITGRSYLLPGIRPSSSGTLSVSASTRFKIMMLTLIGLAV